MATDRVPQLDQRFKDGFEPPQRTGLIGMYFFLAALAMLFLSGMLGYVIIRLRLTESGLAISLPASLWLSTALIVASSITIHLAVRSIRDERQRELRRWLLVTLVLALAFVAVQAPSLWTLLSAHGVQQARGVGIYGLIFFLVLLHALHVVGGIVALARTNLQARALKYDHERYEPVRYAALYWHFLDAIWIIMFAIMLVVG